MVATAEPGPVGGVPLEQASWGAAGANVVALGDGELAAEAVTEGSGIARLCDLTRVPPHPVAARASARPAASTATASDLRTPHRSPRGAALENGDRLRTRHPGAYTGKLAAWAAARRRWS